MANRLKLTVEMNVTVAQALALKAMFEYWNQLSSIGASRIVGFYVDGDGDFHPECTISTDQPLPELTVELRTAAVVSDNDGNRTYDFDPVAWRLREE